jgi:hypothetical protein
MKGIKRKNNLKFKKDYVNLIPVSRVDLKVRSRAIPCRDGGDAASAWPGALPGPV